MKDPNSKEVWTNYAVSCYLAEDYETTISTIETILRFNDEDILVKKQLPPLSLMEVLVLKVKAYEKLGKVDEALALMNEQKASFLDVNQREDLFGRLYVAKGFGEKAIEHFEKLLEQNSCNHNTYYKILEAKHIKLYDEHGKPLKL